MRWKELDMAFTEAKIDAAGKDNNSNNRSRDNNTTNTNTNPTPKPVKFRIGRCDKCGQEHVELRIPNNPLLTSVNICFNCIQQALNPQNLDQADFFCRTFNLPFDAELWMKEAEDCGKDVFKEYTRLVLGDSSFQPNLYYTSSTHDLWLRANKEWNKCRSFAEILQRLKPLKESYTIRGRLKWGEQYSFEDLIRLDSRYTRTLKANNITNPSQKEAVKTLYKLQLQLDEAIKLGDSKGIKDYSTAWGTFAKQAGLENMITETRTADITTVAELSDYLEKTGFVPTYDCHATKDEVDQAIKDIQEANRRTILESTSIQPLLEDLVKKQKEALEDQKTKQATSATTLQELMNFSPDTAAEEIAVEPDADVQNLDFSAEKNNNSPIQVKPMVPNNEGDDDKNDSNSSNNH